MSEALQFASLGSGSKGNATLVKHRGSLLMVDCGFSIKETERRLQLLGHSPKDLRAILVSHEHGDHIKGVGPLARKYGTPVYASHGTALHRDLQKGVDLRLLSSQRALSIDNLSIRSVAVPHDAREPYQFIFHGAKKSFGLLTDLGSITPHVTEQYRACDALMLECNHDSRMLAVGPYPSSLKRRVGGQWGHLNNQQAANLLSYLELERLQHLVISHISAQNNTVELARAAISAVFGDRDGLALAQQDQGFDWLSVS